MIDSAKMVEVCELKAIQADLFQTVHQEDLSRKLRVSLLLVVRGSYLCLSDRNYQYQLGYLKLLLSVMEQPKLDCLQKIGQFLLFEHKDFESLFSATAIESFA